MNELTDNECRLLLMLAIDDKLYKDKDIRFMKVQQYPYGILIYTHFFNQVVDSNGILLGNQYEFYVAFNEQRKIYTIALTTYLSTVLYGEK